MSEIRNNSTGHISAKGISLPKRKHANSFEPIPSLSPNPTDTEFNFEGKNAYPNNLRVDINGNNLILSDDSEPEFKIETGVPECVDGIEIKQFCNNWVENEFENNNDIIDNEFIGTKVDQLDDKQVVESEFQQVISQPPEPLQRLREEELEDQRNSKEQQMNGAPTYYTQEQSVILTQPQTQPTIYSINTTQVIRTQPTTTASNNMFFIDPGLHSGAASDCRCCFCCWDGLTDVLCFPCNCLFGNVCHNSHHIDGGIGDHHCCHNDSIADCNCCDCGDCDCGDCGGCDCDCGDCDCNGCDCSGVDCNGIDCGGCNC